jgi:electron transfer flavoprotein beta subunit
MKIMVCVKHVPAGRLVIGADSLRVDRTGPGELNDVDRNAIEEALGLKEDAGDEVVAVCMGPDAATESLRTALAMGADRAVLVSDVAAAGSDLLGTSRVLASVVERERPELVLFGQQTLDGGGGILWAAVADRVRMPFVSQASELTIDGETVRVVRETEYGHDVIEAQLPVLVAVSDAINEPRYASLKGMMGAKKKPLEVLTLADLGLEGTGAGDAGAGTSVLGMSDPPARANSVRVEDDGSAAQVICDFLAERELV